MDLPGREVSPTITYPQRRPSPRVRHPLLIRHLAYWNPIERASATETPDSGFIIQATRERLALAEETIACLGRKLKNASDKQDGLPRGVRNFSSPQGINGPWSLDQRLVIFEFDWWVFHATIRIELDVESLNITNLLDLAPDTGRDFKSSEANGQNLLDQLKIFQNLVDACDADDITIERHDLSETAETCFHLVWSNFFDNILFTPEAPLSHVGQRFVDFRGVVLGDAIDETKDPAFYPFQEPFWYRSSPDRPRDAPDISNPDAHWRGRARILWPLMTAPIKDADLIDHEFTATIFDGSALYITALGAQPTGLTDADSIPLYYGIYTTGMGGWAIGRLVAKINEIGTLRISSLQDIDKLHEAFSLLREAEIIVQLAFDREAQQHVTTPRKTVKSLSKDLENIRRRIREADRTVPGGVAYRIDQSRNYIRTFNKIVEDLGVESVGGYQPYPRFVDSKHRSAFSYIEMLCTRHERLNKDVRTLYQRYQTEQIRSFTKSIEGFQEVADFVLMAFLAPYYLGMILTYVWWGYLWPAHEHGAPATMWSGIFLFFLWLGIGRMKKGEIPIEAEEPLRGWAWRPRMRKQWTLAIANMSRLAMLVTLPVLAAIAFKGFYDGAARYRNAVAKDAIAKAEKRAAAAKAQTPPASKAAPR